MSYFSDDPAADFDRYDRDLEKLLQRRPKCCKCGKHIQDEHYFYIQGEELCISCAEDMYLYETEVWGE